MTHYLYDVISTNLKKRGMSIRKLSEESKINHSFILEIMRGKKNPTFKTMIRLASALQISPKDMMPETVEGVLDDASE